MADKKMTFGIGIKTTYDASGINKLKNDLTSLTTLGKNVQILPNKGNIEDVSKAITAANTLKNALNQAYNPKLGTVTFDKFNKTIKQSGTTLKQLKTDMHSFGIAGDKAFLDCTTSMMKMSTVARSTHTVLDKMFTTFKNTITWGLSSTLWNNMTGSVQKTYYYIKDLDTALNDIRIVTGKSNEEMAQFAKNANEAAKALGTSTRNYAEGSLIYYQQGLNDEEVKTRTDITAKTALVTGQSMDQVSEQLTAVWNGYKVSAEEAELYVDRLAAVAATTASDLEELSTGMSKVASAAANLGVSESQLSAILATTISVTRQAPENVGTAYKTIFARISDIKAGLDTETTFGNYTSKMNEMGISVLDATGNLRDMGEVIEEIGSKWNSMTREQQVSLAQTMAGTRQYNNLIALFDNWSDYEKTLQTAENAAGTLAKQHGIALDSINNRLNVLKATWEDLYGSLISDNDIKDIITSLTNLVQVIANLTEGLGGLKNILPIVGGLFLQMAAPKIGQELGSHINSLQVISQLEKQYQQEQAAIKQDLMLQLGAGQNADIVETSLSNIAEKYATLLNYNKYMTEEEKQGVDAYIEQEKALARIQIELEKNKQILESTNLGATDSKTSLGLANRLGYGVDVKDTQKLIASGSQLKAFGKDIEDMVSESFSSENGDIGKELDNLTKTFVNLAQEANLPTAAIEGFKKELASLNLEFKDNGELVSESAEKFTALARKTQEAGQDLVKFGTSTEVAATSAKHCAEGFNTMRQSLEVRTVIDDVVQLAGVLSSVGFSIRGIHNLIKTLNNDSMSTGEKILTVLTSIGFILPGIVKSFTTISKWVKEFKTATAAITAAKVDEIGPTTILLTEEQKAAKAAQAKKKAEEGVAKAIEAQNLLLIRQAILAKASPMNTELAEINDKIKVAPGKDLPQLFSRRTELTKQMNDMMASADYFGVQSEEAFAKAQALEEESKALFTEATTGVTAVSAGETAAASATGGAATGATGLIGFLAANPAVLGTIVAVAATLGTIALVIGQIEKAQEKATQKSLEDLKVLKEKNDAREEEINKLNEVATSYKDLEKQFDKNEITEIEYRNQVLALTESIEDQRIKLALLRGEYETFGDTLQSIMREQNQELIENYSREILNAQSTMVAAGVQGTSGGQDFWKSITGGQGLLGLVPGVGQVGMVANMINGAGADKQIISRTSDLWARDELNESLKKNLGENVNTFAPGGIQLKNLTDKDQIVAIYEGIDKTIQENAHLANTEPIKELTVIRDNMQEAYEIQKDAEDKMKELQKQNLIYQYTDKQKVDTIKSAEAYAQAISDMTNAAMTDKIFGDEEDSYIKARIWANGVLSNINQEAIEWSKKNAIVDSLIESIDTSRIDEEEVQKLYDTLLNSDYTEAELRAALPIFFSLGESSAEEFINGLTKYLEKDGVKQFAKTEERLIEKNKISSAIALANEKKTFNTEQGQKLLEDTKLNNKDFYDKNFGNQMLTALWEHNQMGLTEEEVANRTNDLKEEKARIEAEYQAKLAESATKGLSELQSSTAKMALDTQISEEGNLVEFDEEGNKTFELTKEQLADLAETYQKADNSLSAFSVKQQDLIDELKVKYNLDEEQLANVLESIDLYDNQKQKLQELSTEILTITEEQQDWGKISREAASVMDTYNGYLDDMQSAYKTLDAAQKEWNLNEGFSVDTLQNLLKMNPMYLEAMEMEGDQFKLNTDRLNELARAEAHTAVNSWEMSRAALYGQVAQEGVDSVAYSTIMALELEAGAAEDLGDAYWQAARDAINASKEIDRETKNILLNKMQLEQSAGDRYHQITDKVDLAKDTKKSGKSSKKDEKNYKDEFDRYWEFLKAIEKVGNAIEKLNKQEKNLFGKEKISLLKNKNDLLKQQVKTYNDLYEEQKREQSELMGALGGKGVTFNAEGEITNYAKRTSEALAQYNAAVAAYNAGTLSETAFKTAEKAYEDFKKEIDRYDKLYYDEMKDTMDKIDDINREVLANNLSAWEIEIKLKIDWESLQREWIDFLSDINEDFTRVYADLSADLEKSLKKATTYTEQSGTLDTDLQAIYDVMHEIDKFEAGGKSDMFESISQAQEKLKTLNTDLMKDSETLYKLWQDAYKTYLEGIDQLNDKFEEQMGYYERIDKELQHQKNLIGLLYGDEAYQMMETLYRNQEKNQLAEIDSLRRQRDLWEEQWKKAAEGSQEQLKYYQLMTEAQDNLNDSVEDYIKLLQDDATNAIDNILNNYDNWLSNGQGLDTLKADWDDLSDYIDKYYDSVESVYYIENLALKIREGIDEQDSVANQKKLQDLYDKEITYLKEKENLTEYDIKAAEQRYNIALKEIALQDAQDAKNSMKVTRDTNGNWTYQYVADTEEEDKKKQELSDEIYKLYELANNAYNQNLSDLMSLQEEYLARMKEIELEEIKTGKDMTAERDKLNQWYFDNYERLSEENLDYQRDMADAGTGVLKAAYESKVYDLTDFTDTQKKLIEEATKQNIQDFESLSKSVEENISGLGDLTIQMLSETVPEWTAGAREMADAWNADDGISIKSQVTEATEEIINTILDYQESLDELEETAGVDFDLIIDTINDTTDATEDLKDMVEELCDTNDLDNYRDAVDDLADAWYGVKDAIKDAIRQIEIYLQKLGQTSNVSVSTNIPTSGGGTPGNSDNNNDDIKTTPTTGYWWSINSSGDAVIGEVGSDEVYATIGRKSDARRAGEGIKRYGMATFKDTSESAAYLERASREGLLQGISYEDLTRNLSSWFKNIPKLNTGGYTGDWLNGDGRLAILHKKELVLNEADTANFLSAVGMIREIASFGTSIEDNIAFGLASFMDKFSGGISINGKGNTDNSKQNIFNINAPITSTATTDEIQRAIIELPNLASQYAARNAF